MLTIPVAFALSILVGYCADMIETSSACRAIKPNINLVDGNALGGYWMWTHTVTTPGTRPSPVDCLGLMIQYQSPNRYKIRTTKSHITNDEKIYDLSTGRFDTVSSHENVACGFQPAQFQVASLSCEHMCMYRCGEGEEPDHYSCFQRTSKDISGATLDNNNVLGSLKLQGNLAKVDRSSCVQI